MPYDEVRIHISAEALTRALSVFEGVKGYWDDASTSFAIRGLDRHYRRLRESAAILEIPMPVSYEEYLAACATLVEQLLAGDTDLWLRTTLYVVEGHWGEGTRADLVITGFQQPKRPPGPISLTVSSWKRATDDVLPTRAKSSANYVGGRLARIEAHRRGFDDAIMLNAHGRVSEATGACVLSLKDGVIVTPPVSEGALNSITTAVIEEICQARGLAFERRPLERTELLLSDEVGIAGTITELASVTRIDGVEFDRLEVLPSLQAEYLEAMRARRPFRSAAFQILDFARAVPAAES